VVLAGGFQKAAALVNQEIGTAFVFSSLGTELQYG
jgi:hypothetical protein